MSFEDAVNRKAIDLGKLSVEMTTAAGAGIRPRRCRWRIWSPC